MPRSGSKFCKYDQVVIFAKFRLVLRQKMKNLALSVLLSFSFSTSAVSFDHTNAQHVAQCDTLRDIQIQMQLETEQRGTSAYETRIYWKLNQNRQLQELAVIIASLTEAVRHSVNSRVGYGYNVFGLCYGVSVEALAFLAPYVGKACNDTPEGTELSCIKEFLSKGAKASKISDKDVQKALREIQKRQR